MIMTVLILILTNIAFFGVGGFLLYYGYQSVDIFVALCGAGCVGIMLLLDFTVANRMLINSSRRKNQERRAANHEKSETGSFEQNN